MKDPRPWTPEEDEILVNAIAKTVTGTVSPASGLG